MSVDVIPQPQCPAHPDALAVKTCARCGGFMCEACAQEPSGLCLACIRHSRANLPSSARRATVSVVFLSIVGAAEAGRSIECYWALADANENLGRDIFGGFVALGLLVGFVGSVIAYLMWTHRVVRQLNGVGVDVGATPGWAVGYWFVPFVNLVKPYRIVRRIVESVGGDAVVSPVVLGVWWAAWIIGNVVDNMETRAAGGIFSEVETQGSLTLGMVGGVIGAIGAFLCARIVRSIQRHLVARREEAAVAGGV